MRVLVQRSNEANVKVDNKIIGKINNGLVLLVGLIDFAEFSPKKVTIWATTKHLVLCS